MSLSAGSSRTFRRYDGHKTKQKERIRRSRTARLHRRPSAARAIDCRGKAASKPGLKSSWFGGRVQGLAGRGVICVASQRTGRRHPRAACSRTGMQEPSMRLKQAACPGLRGGTVPIQQRAFESGQDAFAHGVVASVASGIEDHLARSIIGVRQTRELSGSDSPPGLWERQAQGSCPKVPMACLGDRSGQRGEPGLG